MPDTAPTLLLTRPAASARRFLGSLRAAGVTAPAIISPLIEVEFLDTSPVERADSGLILTSENGATAAARMGFGAQTPAFCVGAQTASAAREAGLDAVSAQGDAEALIALILQGGARGPLLHLRGEHARGDIAARLSAAGVLTRDLVVYRQHARPLTPEAAAALAGTGPVVAPLFSPRTVAILAGSGPVTAPLTLVAISQAVVEAAATLAPGRLIVAASPDGAAMLDATIAALADGAVLETGSREG